MFWEYRYAGAKHKVLIECKHYDEKVSLIHARNMYGLLSDIPNSSGILVTTKGFQSGVKTYTNFYEIGLKILRLPKDADWDGRIQTLNIDMTFIRNNYTDLNLVYDLKDPKTREVHDTNPGSMSLPIENVLISDSGAPPIAINLWLDKHVGFENDSYGIEQEIEILPKDSFLHHPDGYKLKLGKALVKYSTSSANQTLTHDYKSFVDAVLEDCNSGEVEHMLRGT